MAVKKVAVYIGRFQPLHLGHTHIISTALKKYDALIILVGSSGEARQVRNPFTFKEREEMIRAYRNEYAPAGILFIRPLYNFLYNDTKWMQYVQETVSTIIDDGGWKNPEITVVGSDRDDTTWYVHAFPQWKQDLFPKVPEGKDLSATSLRDRLFAGYSEKSFLDVNGISQLKLEWGDVPSTTFNFLRKFVQTDDYEKLKHEYDHIENYKRGWAVAPYPPTFVTTDAVVIQSGHVLVVVRGALPGEGLWALPGGFLAGRLRLKTNAVKEVMEETGIRLATGKRDKELTESLLEKSIIGSQTFDDPDRSARGRTITTAFLFRLDDTKPLPKVKGMFAPPEDTGGKTDVVETSNAMWVPISEARNRREMWFEDHWSILDAMLGLVKDN